MTRHDLDFMVRPEDAERALEALVDAGMRPERPPEEWLYKAWDGEVGIDLIFEPKGLPVTDQVVERGEDLQVFSVSVRVMAIEDVLSTKLLALSEHALDYEGPLQIARSLREQVDWRTVKRQTSESPYAAGWGRHPMISVYGFGWPARGIARTMSRLGASSRRRRATPSTATR